MCNEDRREWNGDAEKDHRFNYPTPFVKLCRTVSSYRDYVKGTFQSSLSNVLLMIWLIKH